MQTKCLSLHGIKTHAQQMVPGSGGGGGSSATTDAASLLAMERVVMRPLRRPWLLAVFRPRAVLCSLPSSSSPSHFSLSLLMSLRRQRRGIKALLHTELNSNIYSDGRSEQKTELWMQILCEFLTCWYIRSFGVYHRASIAWAHTDLKTTSVLFCVFTEKSKIPFFFIINSTFFEFSVVT